jgi:pimeloyl-ACP methyl ester carboxylesterase
MLSLMVVALALLAGWAWAPDLDRQALEARYAQPPSRFVEVAGIRLHVRESGPRDAPAVLLLHGFGASLQTWDGWAPGLEGDRRVIRYDLPGAALTGPDPTGDYSDERGEQVLLALMDRLGLPRASLVGHSLGGRLAWRMAADHPERVDKLVLVAPDGFASPGFEYEHPPAVPAALGLMEIALPRALLRTSLEAAYGNPALLSEASVDRYYDLMRAPGVRGAMIERMEQILLHDPVPSLARIRAPTLLIWGSKDTFIPQANAEDYLRAMPDATLHTLSGVGHLVQEEAPAASLAPVSAFLHE